MKKFVVIPDSYKGTLTSKTVCSVMQRKILEHFPTAEVVCIPVADGGEGSVQAFLEAMGGELVQVQVHGPYGESVNSFYGLLPDGTAVIEMAAAAGLPMVGNNKQAHKTTTYGVGELMLAAAKRGCARIIMGLGGSATNDGGCGAAAACGVKFLNKDGQSFVPVGEGLQDIVKIDASGLASELKQLPIITMCDIDNPLCGERGAAAVFAPQKGASPEQVAMLDAGLAHLAEVVQQELSKAILNVPGAGAAGGMGGGMVAFFHSSLQMGIETVLDTVDFDSILQNADVVFTGEGCFDEQSMMGKVICGVIKRAKAAQVPVVCVAGSVSRIPREAYEAGLTAAFSINQKPLPFAEAAPLSEENLSQTMDNILRLLKI